MNEYQVQQLRNDRELNILKLRNLIASKEFVISASNLDLSKYGAWQLDHAQEVLRIDNEISEVIKDLD